MPDRILETKLSAPEPHPLAVDRDAALDWLDANLVAGGEVALCSLPGSGRLDLLARWTQDRSPNPTAWLRLDHRDGLERYVRHLIAALQTVDPRIGADVVDVADEEAEVQRDSVLPALVADCVRHGVPFNVVVHGVDLVMDTPAIRAVRATHRNRAPNVGLIWLSDDDAAVDFTPVDGVAHLPRMESELLAFTADDVLDMYERIDVAITAEQAAAVVRSTNGWALAVLHGVERARRSGTYTPYDPSDPELAAQVDRTTRIPVELRATASDLALLGPVTAAQFEEMTDRADADAVLARLERRHVVRQRADRWSVVVPLRQHLRILRETQDAPAAVVLRRRAARAAADAGDVQRALGLLEEAGDADARARLLLERHRQWSADGEPAVADHVMAAQIYAPAQAELHLVRAWNAVFNEADLERAEAYIDAAERFPLDGARSIRARSEVEFLRAILARRSGRLADCAEHARTGLAIGQQRDAESADDLTRWPYMAVVPVAAPLYVGHCLFHAGALAAARDELLEANASRSWSEPALAAMHGVLGIIGWIERDPSAQIHGAIAASNLGDRLNSSTHLAAAALALTGVGVDAEAVGERYVREAPAIGEPTSTVFGHIVAIHQGAGDARSLHAAARRVVEACPQPGVLSIALARAAGLLDLPDDAPDLGEQLTDGERRVVLALRGDLTEREIAAELHLSHNTVRAYRRRAYRKLGVSSREDAVTRLAALDDLR